MTLEEKASQLVNQARAIPRLKVPAYNWWSEALHGVAVDGTTEFPEPIGLGATFDAPAIHQMAIDIGIEGRIVHAESEHDGNSTIFHGLDFWAPNLNIFRDPRWGRGQETYGEDPFLTAHMRQPEILPRNRHAQALRRAQRPGAHEALRGHRRQQTRRTGHLRTCLPRRNRSR
jgi:beta-glucosidase-like glycosyl hydrolase